MALSIINLVLIGCVTSRSTNVYTEGQALEAEAVEEGVDAGTADMPVSFCFNEDEIVALSGLIIGGNPGGNWTETSSSPSQGNAFDPVSGTFYTDNQLPGDYTFQYTVQSGGACPDDFEEVTVTVNPLADVLEPDHRIFGFPGVSGAFRTHEHWRVR